MEDGVFAEERPEIQMCGAAEAESHGCTLQEKQTLKGEYKTRLTWQFAWAQLSEVR